MISSIVDYVGLERGHLDLRNLGHGEFFQVIYM